MKILDRYLLRHFIKTLLICYVSLTGLYVVFDAFTNLEGFLHYAEQHSGLLAVMGEFYFCRAILLFDRTAGLLALAAAMFTIAWIQRHNELTALMAAGVPRVRLLGPMVAATALIVLAAAASRELLIPRFRDQLARKPKQLGSDAPQQFQPQFDDRGILIRGEATVAEDRRIEKPVFRLPLGVDFPVREITARQAFYQPPEEGRPAGYLLEGVGQPKDLARLPSVHLGGQPVLITPRDDPGRLQPDQCFLVTTISFEQLTNSQAWREFSSTAQLIAGLRGRSADFGGRVRVVIHGRFVQPLLDMTLLLLGVPLVLARQDRNVFVALGLCAGVVTLFMLLVMGCQWLGANYAINPALAAWAPLVILVPAAIEMTCWVWE
ncbi:MAG: LptF/LptG family permease [Thermoguttaceae bacterium]